MKIENVEEELKDCPFCGGTAELIYDEEDHPFVYKVFCLKCCCKTDSYSYSEFIPAIRIWNSRV